MFEQTRQLAANQFHKPDKIGQAETLCNEEPI